jgi:hypothetical protein
MCAYSIVLVDCMEKAIDPCFIVSGSMLAYTVGMERETAETQMWLAIHRAMSSGAIAATISRVNGASLLDSSLNLATLPATALPIIQTTQTPSPITAPPTPITPPPTRFPVTSSPTPAPTNAAPTPVPTTSSPTPSPSTDSPSDLLTLEPSNASYPSVATVAKSNEPSGAPSLFFNTGALVTRSPTGTAPVPTTQTMTMPPTMSPTNWTESKSPTLSSGAEGNTATTPLESTRIPLPAPLQDSEENQTAFEKVPMWAWAVIVIAICACCTYTDPTKEDEAVVQANLGEINLRREKEIQNLMNDVSDHENHIDYLNDSEANHWEYHRKLYRR